MNIINLTENEAKQLYQWKDNNRELVRKFYPVFYDVLIKVDNKAEVEYHLKDNILSAKFVIPLVGKVAEITYALEKHWRIIETKNYFQESIENLEKERGESLEQEFITLLHTVFSYMLYYKEDLQEETQIKRTKAKVKGKYKYTGTITIKNYKFTRIQSESKVTKKRKQFSLEAWGVRGHWRHYKSGKTVFVRPYVKGKNKVQAKEYILKYKEKE